MRLIDADALLKDVTSRIDFCEDILEIIDAQPSLDEKLESAYAEGFTFAESKFHERKKGKWIDEGQYAEGHSEHAYYCSQCEEHYIGWIGEFNFCPNCGADMR